MIKIMGGDGEEHPVLLVSPNLLQMLSGRRLHRVDNRHAHIIGLEGEPPLSQFGAVHRLLYSLHPLLATHGQEVKLKQRVAPHLLCRGTKLFLSYPLVLGPGEGFLEGV